MPAVPHGGSLVDRVLPDQEAHLWLDESPTLPQLALEPRQILDLELLSVGAFSPLSGFMARADYTSVVESMRLASGVLWPLPITLATSSEQGAGLTEGHPILLTDAEGCPRATLELHEKYPYDRVHEARMVFRTEDAAHPGVRALYEQGDILLGGDIWLLVPPTGGSFPSTASLPIIAR